MEVVSICRDQLPKNFNTAEAQELLEILLKITRKYKQEVQRYKSQFEYFKYDPIKSKEYEKLIHDTIQLWGHKISRLGAMPTGVWQAVVPGIEGTNYEWQFPNSSFSNVQ